MAQDELRFMRKHNSNTARHKNFDLTQRITIMIVMSASDNTGSFLHMFKGGRMPFRAFLKMKPNRQRLQQCAYFPTL